MLLIKTKVELIDKLTEEIIKNHTYETPEIVQIDSYILSEKYSQWFNNFFTSQTPK
ncbi:MAG: divalent cation tolerance protein CutA [Fidelibacterota bacterium]